MINPEMHDLICELLLYWCASIIFISVMLIGIQWLQYWWKRHGWKIIMIIKRMMRKYILNYRRRTAIRRSKKEIKCINKPNNRYKVMRIDYTYRGIY